LKLGVGTARDALVDHKVEPIAQQRAGAITESATLFCLQGLTS
jgi:hypothetical protein